MICPKCGSENYVRNGHIRNGKQKYMCKECAGQFVENPENKIISMEIKDIIGNLLPEKISLAGAARVTGVSEKWLREYVNRKFDEVPRKTEVTKKEKGRLTIGCDEMWSYVGSKKNKVWIWLAKDIGSKEIADVT